RTKPSPQAGRALFGHTIKREIDNRRRGNSGRAGVNKHRWLKDKQRFSNRETGQEGQPPEMPVTTALDRHSHCAQHEGVPEEMLTRTVNEIARDDAPDLPVRDRR